MSSIFNFLLDTAIVVLTFVAAVLQLAVIRDRSIMEIKSVVEGRWILFAAYTMLFCRYFPIMVTSGDILIPSWSEVAICLICLGHIRFSCARLSKDHHDATPKS